MAGYLITLNNEEALKDCIRTGSYSTILKQPKSNNWGLNHEGTFADYLSMNEGDRIFFFIHRKIYGCGSLVNLGDDCKYLNYISADEPQGNSPENYETHILNYGNAQNRCFCVFKPDPYFFQEGVDMDEVLQHKSCPFHSLRTLWKLSFIKLDDDESEALFEIILKHNEEGICNSKNHFEYDETNHFELLLHRLSEYRLSYASLVKSCLNDDSTLRHEMAIEATLCKKLLCEDVFPFGKWDYISHQVVASPFKPIDYMDKMDVFGYRYIPGYRVKSRYLIAELKKDVATKDVVEQIMKYVDWVASEYVDGDYSMIEAFVVATDFDDEIKKSVKNNCIRNFNKGFRPTKFCTWENVKLVKYTAKADDIAFDVVQI